MCAFGLLVANPGEDDGSVPATEAEEQAVLVEEVRTEPGPVPIGERVSLEVGGVFRLLRAHLEGELQYRCQAIGVVLLRVTGRGLGARSVDGFDQGSKLVEEEALCVRLLAVHGQGR